MFESTSLLFHFPDDTYEAALNKSFDDIRTDILNYSNLGVKYAVGATRVNTIMITPFELDITDPVLAINNLYERRLHMLGWTGKVFITPYYERLKKKQDSFFENNPRPDSDEDEYHIWKKKLKGLEDDIWKDMVESAKNMNIMYGM